MDDAQINALREAAEAAIPGPWELTSGHDYPSVLRDLALHRVAEAYTYWTGIYIAAASPDVVLSLLDRLASAESRADAAELERDEARAEAEAHNVAATQYEKDIAELRAEVARLTAERDAARQHIGSAPTRLRQLEQTNAALNDLLSQAEAERDARPEITGEEAFTWIGCRGGPTEKKVNATLKAFGLRWNAAQPAPVSVSTCGTVGLAMQQPDAAKRPVWAQNPPATIYESTAPVSDGGEACENCGGFGSFQVPFSYGRKAQCRTCNGTGRAKGGDRG